MLVVDPEKRFTVDQCLKHPWMTASTPRVEDSTDGLVGGVAGLEVSRRGVARERTLLSSINTVQVTNRVAMGDDQTPLKIYAKNPKQPGGGKKEPGPAEMRDPKEFIELGGKGDQSLFGNDGNSNYSKKDIAAAKDKGKGKAKGRPNGR